MTNDSSWLPRLSEALGLIQEYEQDWGICNADASRVLEFIAFFESHTVIHPWEPEALAELIFESFNNLALAGPPPSEIQSALRVFIGTHEDAFPTAMEYWSGLGEEAFPVSAYVAKLK